MKCQPNQVQIDLDSIAAMHALTYHRRILRRYKLTRGWRWRITPSRTPGHAHVTITLPSARPLLERILLASILGSDRTRETLNYIRGKKGAKVNVLFFEDTRKPRETWKLVRVR